MIFDYPLQISQITKIKCVVTWQQYWVSRNPIRGLRIFESKNRPFHPRFDFFLHHPIHVTKFSHFRNLKWNVKDKDSLNVVTSFFPNFIAFHLFIIYLFIYCKQSLHKGLGPLSRPNHIQIKISPLAGRPAPPLSSPESTVT